MAVGFISAGASTFVSAVGSHGVTLNTTGGRCGIIFAVTYVNAGVSIFTTASIGGVSAPVVTGGEAADTATEPGNVKSYFLDNIVQGASTVFSVNRTNNAVVAGIYAICFSALSACEVHLPGIVLLQADGAIAEQSVTDGSPGTNSRRCAAGYGGAASPPSVGVNSVNVGFHDATSFGSRGVYESAAGQGARLVGMTMAADDRAVVHLPIREVPVAAAPRPPRVPATLQAVKRGAYW